MSQCIFGVGVMSKKEQERLRLLFALIKGARRSDRELARTLRISQPTITRKRTQLEKEGYIREYTIIPDLGKTGYEILAFTFLAFTKSGEELFDNARDWTKKKPNIIFAADGEGLGMGALMVSAHKNYSGLSRLITELRHDWQPNIKDVQSFIISVDRPDLIVKEFSLRYLEKT